MQLSRYTFSAMGSPCVLHLYGAAGFPLDDVAARAIAEVARIERKFSRYRSDSVIARINDSAGDAKGVEVDPETAALLNYACTLFRESGGLFDVTSGILRRAWNFKSGVLPQPEVIAGLLSRVGWQRVRWCPPRLVLPLPGMEIDFGGFGKEYAADRVAEQCRRRGVRHGLVDLGGDLAVIGPHPGGAAWKVGVRHPRRPGIALATVSLTGGGIASSGDYERCMVVDGVRYGHVLDPRTGWPVSGLASVSVTASHCLLAGTATTVAMLLGQPDGPGWLDRLGLPNLRVTESGAVSGNLAFREAA